MIDNGWKCGNCGIVYQYEDWHKLDSIPMIDDDEDPTANYGYTKVCPCGYRFHRDKWHKETVVTLNGVEITVSSVFLELNHGWNGEDAYYETMLFTKNITGELEVEDPHYQWRYATQEQAEEHHKKIVASLPEVIFVPKTYELVLKDDIEETSTRVSPEELKKALDRAQQNMIEHNPRLGDLNDKKSN
jgi:hypothetical protein